LLHLRFYFAGSRNFNRTKESFNSLSFIDSSLHSFINYLLLIHSFIHTFFHSFIHSYIYGINFLLFLIHLFIHSFINYFLLIHSFIHELSFIPSFIPTFINFLLFLIHLFIHKLIFVQSFMLRLIVCISVTVTRILMFVTRLFMSNAVCDWSLARRL